MDCLIPMGVTSENVVKTYGLQRSKLDAFAMQSNQKAAATRARGKFLHKMVPIGDVANDDGIHPNTALAILGRTSSPSLKKMV
jgi:acetyl-CoA acyltransferase 1